jgi:hypothetical protein
LPQRLGAYANIVLLTALSGLTLLEPCTASAQETRRTVGTLAKAGIVKAKAEARKWRSDSYLFQVAAANVQDGGVTMWNYDFQAPGASGKKCFRVNVAATGEAGGIAAPCAFDNEKELPGFVIDSDQAVAMARKAGVTRPGLRMTLRMASVRNMGDRPVWQLSEGAGSGDKTIEVDAITGQIRSQIRIP